MVFHGKTQNVLRVQDDMISVVKSHKIHCYQACRERESLTNLNANWTAYIALKTPYFSAASAISINSWNSNFSNPGEGRGYINWNRISNTAPDSDKATMSPWVSVLDGGNPSVAHSKFCLCKRNRQLSEERIMISESCLSTAKMNAENRISTAIVSYNKWRTTYTMYWSYHSWKPHSAQDCCCHPW